MTWLLPGIQRSQAVYKYPRYYHYHQVNPAKPGGSFSWHIISLKISFLQTKSLSSFIWATEETQESRVCVWMCMTREVKHHRDAPTVCLILSYVCRLNGSYCYQHHHDLASCHREVHTNTAITWQDSGHRRLQTSKEQTSTVWVRRPQGEPFMKCFLGSCVSVFKPYPAT